MAMTTAFDTAGREVRIPEHWVSHPVLGRPFSATPARKTPARKTPAAPAVVETTNTGGTPENGD